MGPLLDWRQCLNASPLAPHPDHCDFAIRRIDFASGDGDDGSNEGAL
jgi:hypothetical protein